MRSWTVRAEPVSWQRWSEVPRLCFSWRSLRSTVAVAFVVGTVLFAINDLDVVLAGGATSRVWLKAALTYPVPFMVANYGLLVGAHRTEPGREQAALSARLLVMRRKRRGQGD